MNRVDSTVLAGVALGLDTPAFGWSQGVGLRWSLPVGSVIHDPGVDLTGQPRGWPDNGFRIYRADASAAVTIACADLATMRPAGQAAWVAPLSIPTLGITVDWTPPRGIQSLGDSLGNAQRFTLHCKPAQIGLRLTLKATGKIATIEVRCFDATGVIVSRISRQWRGITVVSLSGPGLAKVDVSVTGGVVTEACSSTTSGYPPGKPLHTAYPSTSQSAILTSPIASRLDQTADWAAFANYAHDAVANVDARLVVAPAASGASAPIAGGSDSALVDLLLLFAIDPTIAWLLGLLWWDSSAVAGQEYVYWIVAEWSGVEYVWPVGPIGPKPPANFALPPGINFSATVLPALTPADENGPTGAPATAVGLSWLTGGSPFGAEPHAADVAVKWRVRRCSIPFGTPSATVSTILANAASFLPISVNDVVDVDPSEAPPYLARDTGFAEGDQWWTLTGIDVFGRPGISARVGPVSVWDLRAPPPPERLRARWLDAAAALPAVAPSDPLITESDVAWLAANPQASGGALFVGWEWPPALRVVSPSVREFRVYAQLSGAVLRLAGTISAVMPVAGSPEYSDVLLDTPLPVTRDSFVGGTLSDGRGTFTIVQLAATTESVNRVRVANTRNNQQSSAPPAGSPYGTPSLIQSISPPTYAAPQSQVRATAIANIRPASAWADRIAIVPMVNPFPTSIASVIVDQVVGDSRYVTVRLAGTLTHSNPANGVYVDSGTLMAGSTEFRAQLVTLDAARTLPSGYVDIVLSMPNTDVTLFVTGESVVFYPGVAVYLPHQSFRSATSLREYALVTVTSANDSTAPAAVDDAVHATDSRWLENNAARRGFESVTAPAITIVDVSHTPPAPPQMNVGTLLTTWPDAAGMATFTVTWQPQPSQRYVVLRAAGDTLFASDRIERAATYGTYASAHPALTALGAAYPDPTRPQLPDYAAVYAAAGGAGVLQQIASLDENAGAFAARMAAPLGVADCTRSVTPRTIATTPGVEPTSEPGLWLDGTTGNLVFTDTVSGIGTTLYFYRILAVDSVGNRSSLGPSTPPVTTRVSAVPRAPRISGSRLGDCAVTLLWQHPVDGSVDRYRVYQAANPQQLAEPHLLTPDVVSLPTVILRNDVASGVPADSNFPLSGQPPALPPGLPAGSTVWGWIGTGLPPADMYVMIVAERDIPGGATLRSAPSAPIHIRPMEYDAPKPPDIVTLDRSGPDGGRVTFTADRAWYTVSVEVRGPDSRVWRSVTSGFIAPPSSGTWDFAAAAGVRYGVRLRARNGLGVISAPAEGSLA
jgi:hypothetical protein